ncbi:hypothetical protein GX51_06932 [Blastomyces parvus]|uniref:Uncharacterized protein n=1 Tax=Blastomyces parvus TaxID=2060905 RepID=A0A2B7WNL3_9EURO|nr:hypothetical protein GX51_06932 [Blastomyces parvus]
MAETSLARAIVSSILMGPSLQSIQNEDRHPKRLDTIGNLKSPFLRIWERWSGSKPGQTERILSRPPRQSLDTLSTRRESLTIHRLDASSFHSVDNLYERVAKNCTTYDSKTWCSDNYSDGLPIVNMDAEMRYDVIPDLYGQSYYLTITRTNIFVYEKATEHEVIEH